MLQAQKQRHCPAHLAVVLLQGVLPLHSPFLTGFGQFRRAEVRVTQHQFVLGDVAIPLEIRIQGAVHSVLLWVKNEQLYLTLPHCLQGGIRKCELLRLVVGLDSDAKGVSWLNVFIRQACDAPQVDAHHVTGHCDTLGLLG
jgi:hypothetical protein